MDNKVKLEEAFKKVNEELQEQNVEYFIVAKPKDSNDAMTFKNFIDDKSNSNIKFISNYFERLVNVRRGLQLTWADFYKYIEKNKNAENGYIRPFTENRFIMFSIEHDGSRVVILEGTRNERYYPIAIINFDKHGNDIMVELNHVCNDYESCVQSHSRFPVSSMLLDFNCAINPSYCKIIKLIISAVDRQDNAFL